MKIFLDCDDTIIESSKCIIRLLNRRNGTNKTFDDLKDFQYRSIDKTLTTKDVLDIFESDDFWNEVEYSQSFFSYSKFLKDNFDVEIVSCGTRDNLQKKRAFLNELGFGFTGLLVDESLNLCKSRINMQSGIQIDDNINSLENTNATIKILLKNYREFTWNKTKANIKNLYVVNNWDEIIEILIYIKNNPWFIEEAK